MSAYKSRSTVLLGPFCHVTRIVMLFSNLNNLKYRQGNTTLLKQSKMAEDKTKSSPDEARGNDSKVFSLFCLKSILI